MKLRNILIVVKDIEKSKKFYHDLFGMDVVLDNDGNMILTEGLVLQDAKIWKEFLQKEITWKNHATELYFEESMYFSGFETKTTVDTHTKLKQLMKS